MSRQAAAVAAVKFEKFYRTELYFGLSKPGGSLISDAEWRSFLEIVVTPSFPDGFTVVATNGRYRDKRGRIIAEPGQMIIFLYPASAKAASRAKIEMIRTAYTKKYEQESVLRMDLPKAVRVSF